MIWTICLATTSSTRETIVRSLSRFLLFFFLLHDCLIDYDLICPCPFLPAAKTTNPLTNTSKLIGKPNGRKQIVGGSLVIVGIGVIRDQSRPDEGWQWGAAFDGLMDSIPK